MDPKISKYDWVRGFAYGNLFVHDVFTKYFIESIKIAAANNDELLVDKLSVGEDSFIYKDAAVHHAAMHGHGSLVNKLLRQGASINSAISGATAGHYDMFANELRWRVRHDRDNFLLFKLPEIKYLWAESLDLRMYILFIVGEKLVSNKQGLNEKSSILALPLDILFEIGRYLVARNTQVDFVQFKQVCSTLYSTVRFFKPLEVKLEENNTEEENKLLQELRNNSHEPAVIVDIVNHSNVAVDRSLLPIKWI